MTKWDEAALRQAARELRQATVGAELERTNPQREFSNAPHPRRELSDADQRLLEDSLPSLSGAMVEASLAYMGVIRSQIIADEVDPEFEEDPVAFVEARTHGLVANGEIAPSVRFASATMREMVHSGRLKYLAGDAVLPDEVMAVHTSTSSRSYVRSERRTSFTFEKSNITGTERRAITSSETRTTTVTSGRGLLDLDMRNILIAPDVLAQRLEEVGSIAELDDTRLSEIADPSSIKFSDGNL